MKALPWPVGRYRRILPALTTNQNAEFVTVPSENKINHYYFILDINPQYLKPKMGSREIILYFFLTKIIL